MGEVTEDDVTEDTDPLNETCTSMVSPMKVSFTNCLRIRQILQILHDFVFLDASAEFKIVTKALTLTTFKVHTRAYYIIWHVYVM